MEFAFQKYATNEAGAVDRQRSAGSLGPLPSLDLEGVDWLIAGGESGHRARPVDASWVADLRDACAAAEVAFFFKQWGGRTPKAGGRDLEGRTWDALPLARPRWGLDNRVEQPQHPAAVDGWL
jgi:protein gp37